jgi:hypothetical protein
MWLLMPCSRCRCQCLRLYSCAFLSCSFSAWLVLKCKITLHLTGQCMRPPCGPAAMGRGSSG